MTKTANTEKPAATNRNRKEFARAKEGFQSLLQNFQSIHLATVDTKGKPEASYAPAIMDERNNLYIYVSELSAHTGNLLATGKASAMIIEDETTCATIFARRRVGFECTASEIERHGGEWKTRLDNFTEKFGETMQALRKLDDFHLFRLRPQNGRLVLGFGKAYDITGENADTLIHVRGGTGQGHRIEANATQPNS